MEPIWTPEEKQAATRHDVTIFSEMVEESFFQQKQLPTDVHRVEYTINEETVVDAVRAYKKSDIFDVYYDKLKTINGLVIDIKNGYGSIKPKLFNTQNAWLC